MIERAAANMESTVFSFMLQNAWEVARRLVAEQEVITLSDRHRHAFLAALENPPKPTRALINLIRLRP